MTHVTPKRVFACPVADVPPGASRRVQAEGLEAVALFNVDGRLYATADRCTHGDASLCDGLLFDHVVECPFHGGTFDVVTGQALTYPVTEPLRTFPVEVSDGMAFLIVQGEST